MGRQIRLRSLASAGKGLRKSKKESVKPRLLTSLWTGQFTHKAGSGVGLRTNGKFLLVRQAKYPSSYGIIGKSERNVLF